MANNAKEKTEKKKGLLKSKAKMKLRHIAALKKVSTGASDKNAFKGLGYSASYIRSGKIKNTKSWKEVSEVILNNELLADVNMFLLNHKSWQAKNQGLDKAYKARKIYGNGIEITNKFSGKTKEELIEIILGGITGEGGRKSGIGRKG